MENLQKFKNSIFQKNEHSEELETCFSDFLENFNLENSEILLNLIEMCDKTERIDEILKVFDFVRFPVKKTINF